MREIKFRAWDKKLEFMEDVEVINFGVEVITMNDGGSSTHEWEDVVLMQFTGLKDKNGKEIYEGDILKHISGCVSTIGNMIPLDKAMWHDAQSWSDEYEVIGNIYENMELIK